jgi:hypothetical protein
MNDLLIKKIDNSLVKPCLECRIKDVKIPDKNGILVIAYGGFLCPTKKIRTRRKNISLKKI